MTPKSEADRELTVREKRILYFTIHNYIRANEPIGSRTISKAFDFDMSPATVRNICSDLEEWGYLGQPHTSAGRQPTDKGYRYYINELLKIQEIAARQRERIVREYNEKLASLDDILQKTARLMADVSGHTAVVLYPDRRHVEISRLSLMLDRPDFKDMGQLREAMGVLEEPARLGEIFRPEPGGPDEVDVKLGRELNQPELQEFGVIKAGYHVDDARQGSLGLVGPKRMPYGRLIALVGAVKDAVNSTFRRMRGVR
ncbi:MAG: hypothetical protein A3G34_00885 [Candidatus Lindowbacteria bacterium RIFCSPLOWO2_12_FULL_62_27]|nr:MAG: hypothetical protein A3G34_00885 [Candidatus Lindowbacteria bacterium RIFCSPLOWO2_12_FULL_62_27]OGH58140.1 MAG: hypothetical protein A3I06_00660 [Candidatus Lindowbacteria bacterium RIFCSPLOWO2_02_FULL_62_12]